MEKETLLSQSLAHIFARSAQGAGVGALTGLGLKILSGSDYSPHHDPAPMEVGLPFFAFGILGLAIGLAVGGTQAVSAIKKTEQEKINAKQPALGSRKPRP